MLYDEFFSLTRELEQHHSIFARLWSLGQASESEDIPTAAVYFDKVGETVDFKINPKFWETLTDKQKQFVVSHECLHVILYHGLRLKYLQPSKEELLLVNKALDIVVNHALINKFAFNRQEVDPDNKYCWVDTVFPQQQIADDQHFEYYYQLLKQQQNLSDKSSSANTQESQNGEILDDHQGLEDFSSGDFENFISKKLSPSEAQNFQEMAEKAIEDIEEFSKQAGCNPGNLTIKITVNNVKKKKKWETIIKEWSAKHLKDNEEEQWARTHRRLIFMPTDFFIPSEMDSDAYEKEKLDVWFFQDTSGSCYHFAKRFFTAAKSLPPERFNIRMFCFDTRVYETTLESGKLYGFGGTSFTCIHYFIENEIKTQKTKKYPTVFCITDGMGDKVSPSKPKNWYWFLSENFTHCIPKESNVFMLKDYE